MNKADGMVANTRCWAICRVKTRPMLRAPTLLFGSVMANVCAVQDQNTIHRERMSAHAWIALLHKTRTPWTGWGVGGHVPSTVQTHTHTHTQPSNHTHTHSLSHTLSVRLSPSPFCPLVHHLPRGATSETPSARRSASINEDPPNPRSTSYALAINPSSRCLSVHICVCVGRGDSKTR